MASRRMFSKDVVCSDRFLDMPASAQLLLKDVDMIKYALLLLFRLEKRIIKHICEKH